MRFARQRHGFTLVELLVVIAMIGILIALLLPAIQAAREAARRTQCRNNLLQINLAVQSYEGTYEMYPAAVLDAGAAQVSNTPGSGQLGWMTRILPFIEQRAAFDLLDYSQPTGGPANLAVSAHEVSTFHCPSDAGPAKPSMVAVSNYAGCHHDVEAPIAESNHGAFVLNRFLRQDDFRDGLSHTIFLGEKSRGDLFDLGWIVGARSSLRNTGAPINTTPEPGLNAFNLRLPLPIARRQNPEDDGLAEKNPNGDGLAGQPTGPLDPVGNPQGYAAALGPFYVGGFDSYHPGGGHFAFGDGSVQYLSESIAMGVYAQLAHRDDGKLPPNYRDL